MTVLFEVESASKAGKKYEIRRGADDVVYCTCPAWKFSRRDAKWCKHLEKAVRDGRLVITTAAVA